MNERSSTRPVGQAELTTLRQFHALNGALALSGTEVEFYFLGGAVIFQAFTASPETGHIDAMFRPAATVRDAVREIARREELPDDWVHQGVRTLMGGGVDSAAYVELSHLSVFLPIPEYTLAVKCAAMRLGDDFHETDDLRYILRSLNVTSADQALSVVMQYFTERQLAPNTRTALEELVGA